MADHIAAVDIGATKITVSICSRIGFVRRIHQGIGLSGDELSIPRQVSRMIGKCCELAEIGTQEIVGVGVSSAGPFINLEDHIALVSPNICGGLAPERGIIPNDWKVVPLGKELTREYHNVAILNDAVSGAVAERTFGAGRGYDDIVYVTWSTGIGTGAYVNGNLLWGKNGNAPHGGHITIVDDGPMCGCGSRGHLEALASGTTIARDYGRDFSCEDVFRAYRKGDGRAVEVIDNAVRHFTKGLLSINSVLDTKRIIVGGSVFLYNQDILLPKIKDGFHGEFPVLTDGVEIVPSELGSYLGDVAALSLIMPEDWKEEWIGERPWENAPETVFLHI
ncbi:MAG: ROK family protein [Thermoplasmatota archaeon]